MSEPEYTNEPTRIADWNNGTALVYGNGRVMTYNVGGERERSPVQVGNVRLFNSAHNAVLELAERLGCNAVLLAERLEGGGLVRLVEALKKMERIYGDMQDGNGDTPPEIVETRAALSHFTTPASR